MVVGAKDFLELLLARLNSFSQMGTAAVVNVQFRIACALAGTVFSGVVGAAAGATGVEAPALEAVVLGESDLPAGYRRTFDFTGSQAGAARRLGLRIPERGAGNAAVVRAWRQDGGGREILEVAMDYRNDAVAAEALCDVQSLSGERAVTRFDVPRVDDADGYVLRLPRVAAGGEAALVHIVTLRQGRFVFLLRTGPDSIADAGLARLLGQRQAMKAPRGSTAPACGSTRSAFGGRLIGALAAATGVYLACVSLVARLRDPLRRLPRGVRGAPPSSVDGGVVDVTATARSRRKHATVRIGLQLLGLCIAAPALLPFLWPDAAGFAIGGFVVGVAAPRVFLRESRSRTRSRRFDLGPRLVVAGMAFTLAVALFLVGVVLLATSGLVSVTDLTREELGAEPDTLQAFLFLLAVGFLVVGSVLWVLARRLAAVRARSLLEQDDRPPLLYLRSFGDDDLRLRVAIAQRGGVFRWLSPRRFERFEEVLVRHLTAVGPVTAVNRPGTRLTPLGAARESLPDATWQETVDVRMDAASWIVVSAAPRSVPPGLEWELRRIEDKALWRKTVLILPPVGRAELEARWATIASVLAAVAGAREALPADVGAVLLSRLSPDGTWTAATSETRDEWSYAAALESALRSAEAPDR
jgi:hypothetical protein